MPGASVTAGGGSAASLVQYRGLRAAFRHTPGFCNYFGNAPRNSIEGPGTVSNNMALSKTMQLGETRSMEIRATINNVFNTVQYSGVNTTYGSPHSAKSLPWVRCGRSSSWQDSDFEEQRS